MGGGGRAVGFVGQAALGFGGDVASQTVKSSCQAVWIVAEPMDGKLGDDEARCSLQTPALPPETIRDEDPRKARQCLDRRYFRSHTVPTAELVPRTLYQFHSNNFIQLFHIFHRSNPSFSDKIQLLSVPLVVAPVLPPPLKLREPPNSLSPTARPSQTRPRGDSLSRSPTYFPHISTPLLWQLLDDWAEKRNKSSPTAGAGPESSPKTRSPCPKRPNNMAANGQIVAAGPELAEISTNVGRTNHRESADVYSYSAF
jgi:hypothetical protein